MKPLVKRLNDWWPFKDPISFQLKENIILIILTEDIVECVGIIRGGKVALYDTAYNSIIQSHIRRVFAASLSPREIEIEKLCDSPTEYKSDFVALSCAVPTSYE
jgi:hypothetical protein